MQHIFEISKLSNFCAPVLEKSNVVGTGLLRYEPVFTKVDVKPGTVVDHQTNVLETILQLSRA